MAVTIRDVAKKAGVSVGTVSNVLSGLVAVRPRLYERVQQAIRDLDFHPNTVARSLKTQRTRILGMVISDITNPFFPQLVRGAEEAAAEHGYLLAVFNTDERVEREKQLLSVLRGRRVDGILLVVAPDPGGSTHVESAIHAGLPIVCLDRIPKGISVDSVGIDNTKSAKICVRHLVHTGHTRIGMLNGSMRLQTARDRLRGYELALREAGLPMLPELVRAGEFRLKSGFAMGKELLQLEPRPTAIFASSSSLGLGLLQAISELKIECPRDIALAVFDEIPGTELFRPHVTALSQPAYQIGYQGAKIIIQRIESGHKKPTRILLEGELRARESTLGYQPKTLLRIMERAY
jgi:LacI family transcriptional regulator